MDTFKIPTEEMWSALPRDERARKVAYVLAHNIIENVAVYEAAHKGNKS